MITTLLVGLAMMEQGKNANIEKWMPTKWTQEAEQGKAWKEYPRPQMVRPDWLNLNGAWEYAITDQDASEFPTPQGTIRVPYPIQSHLSGVQKQVTAKQALWYRRTFEVPKWRAPVTILHFGAVDWRCKVFVNGEEVGTHQGGYDPFSFDISLYLKKGKNEVVVKVIDPTTDGDQPYGKQSFNPSGIWYTAVTGIWQTVWLEPVSDTHITRVYTYTKINGDITVHADVVGAVREVTVKAKAMLKGQVVAEGSAKGGQPISLKVVNPKLWSPSSPTLYDLSVEVGINQRSIETVNSYFGIREVSLKQDAFGVRTYLNNQPIFMFGPLDQGWWPDGLYTPPSDKALKYDLEVTKKAGFNMVRKHVKVEPARFYRHCDELGLLVWQDMPSNLRYGPGWNTNPRYDNPKPDGNRPTESKTAFLMEWQNIVQACRPFTSIVVWVPFNEAWGQFDTAKTAEMTKKMDPTRLVNPASGGNFVKAGDIFDIHVYPGPGTPDPQPGRAIVLGEFGGLGLPLSGHTWQEKDNWGYRTFTSAKEMMVRYEELIKNLVLLKSKGLSAAVYTQTTDVEIETNGLMTYDRAIIKMPLSWLNRVNSLVYGPPVTMQTILPTADEKATEWSYTLAEPNADWFKEDFNASGWGKGMSGFGTEQTPGARVGTQWSSAQIWIRKEFTPSTYAGDLWLKIHHDEDATVYLNGIQIAKIDGYTGDYTFVDIKDGLLKPGTNVLAVKCRQTTGGQYIDAGIYKAIRTN